MPQKTGKKRPVHPAQEQSEQPGREWKMRPRPDVKPPYRGSDKLLGKVALITGGDSGIGRAVAVLFAREGADIVITHLREQKDAKETTKLVEAEGRQCLALSGDIGDESICINMVRDAVRRFGKIDILVNNAAEQHPQESLLKISSKQLERTFRTNIFGYFYMTKAVLGTWKKRGGVIINSTSVTAYRGSSSLLDYSATKGAIVTFTRSLAHSLVEQGIRVNAVAPGPIWTPLIPASFPAEKVEAFGSTVPMQRAGEPVEIAPSYLFLACEDSSYMTGQVLHPNGGEIVGA